MPWVVGVDEAGYGPNLGPLAQAAVAVKLPAHDPAGWATLKPWVRRHAEKDKHRVLVDDSKLVHAGKHGFARLEHAAAAVLGLRGGTVGGYLADVALPDVADDLRLEAWFDGSLGLPLFPGGPSDLRPALREAVGVEVRVVGVKLVTAPVFNRIVAGSDSKGTVLGVGLVNLLAAIPSKLGDGDPVEVIADKQGGRAVYGHYLRGAFPDAAVKTDRETPAESRYRVEGVGRPLTVTFRPKADGESIAVALASCLAKYWREVCMRQFNAYWRAHLPDLKPTAGYPTDAVRFFADIRPALDKLGVADADVWRCR